MGEFAEPAKGFVGDILITMCCLVAGPNTTTTISTQQPHYLPSSSASKIVSPPPTALNSPHCPPGTLFYPTPSLPTPHRSAALASSNPTYSTLGPHPHTHTLPAPVTKTFSAPEKPPLDEVPIREPDLSKRPVRSALKGAKSKELLQKQLQQRLLEKQQQQQRLSGNDSPAPSVSFGVTTGHGDSPRAPPPKIAPKPRVFIAGK